MTDLEIMKHEKPLTSPELTVVERVPINLRPSHSSFHSSLHVILSYAWIACGLLVSARISISIATRPIIHFRIRTNGKKMLLGTAFVAMKFANEE